MRILCLHGSALHGQLFEAKTAKLRSLLPQTYSYEWLDGQYHVVPPKLIRDAYPGPYLSHIESLTTDGMKSAMARLETIIEERGPFDGVMGISEGAMLAASLLIKCQMDRQTSTPRFGIFFAGLIPLTWTDSIGQDVHVLMRKYPLLLDKAVWQQPNTTLCRDRLQALGAEAEFAPEFQSSLQPVKASSRPRCLHPDMHSERLDLPTVHVWGRQDVLSKQSELVLQLCNPDLAESYQHEGGHDVPQLWPDNEAVSEIIQNAILQSEYAL